MNPELEALRQRRAALVDQMRTILEAAESEDRELSAEEVQEYDRIDSEFNGLTVRINRIEALEERTPSLEPGEALRGGNDPEAEERGIATDEYRAAFDAYLRGATEGEQRTTLNVGADADGGFTVPEDWAANVIEALRQAGTIRGLATVITTSGGNPLHLPRVLTDATAPGIVAEQAAIPDDGEAFDEVILGAFKYAKIQKASNEFVQDSMVDVAGFVARRGGFDIGRSQNADFVKGNGAGAPQGLLSGASVGVTTASPTAIVLDEVLDLVYSVIAPYRQNGVFIANDATHASLRKLKDTTGQYLWQPSVQQGEPDRLMGYAIYADPDVDTIAATKVAVGFGNVERAYTIRDAQGLAVKYLEERYADNDQVAWRLKLRSDGKIVDQNAFKTLKMHA
jgi:HK97 family phage major capsid protein